MPATEAKREPIWVPSVESMARTRLAIFIKYCESLTDSHFVTSQEFHDFSFREFRLFWRSFLDWSEIPYSGDPHVVCQGEDNEHASVFPPHNVELCGGPARHPSRYGREQPQPFWPATLIDAPNRLTRGNCAGASQQRLWRCKNWVSARRAVSRWSRAIMRTLWSAYWPQRRWAQPLPWWRQISASRHAGTTAPG